MPGAYCKNKSMTSDWMRLQFLIKNIAKDVSMLKSLGKKTVIGARSGNDIRYACPRSSCMNSIVPSKPHISPKVTRDEICQQCRNHCIIQTPALN
jgi:hypothetical protein